jgi:ABC-type dipeptide/oligopeptide/nickel transport system ATPase component
MIIGLVGYKGSGKTTACNIIKKHLDDVVQINFKDALIEEIKEKFPDLLEAIRENEEAWSFEYGSDFDWSIDDLFIVKPPLVRTLLQNYGTNVRRADDPNYWVSKWSNKVGFGLTHCYKVDNILTDDVRFLNESRAVKEAGGILIRLERTDLEQTDTHQSETEQKEIECDYTITCGAGELDKLEAELVKILDSVE